MLTRSTRSTLPALLLAAAGAALAAPAASAQIHLGAPPAVFGTSNTGLNFFPGSSSSATSLLGPNTLSSLFVGDVVTTLQGANAAGVTYTGRTQQFAVIQFNVGPLPVRLDESAIHANFKLLASGGTGAVDDPLVSASLVGRVHQQVSNAINFSADPLVASSEISRNYIQHGNGLQVLDEDIGPANVNYILSPGFYYMLQLVTIDTSYTGTGVTPPLRGMTMEFGGPLSSGYTGIQYDFNWQTVPTPGSAALLGLAGLAASRRRR